MPMAAGSGDRVHAPHAAGDPAGVRKTVRAVGLRSSQDSHPVLGGRPLGGAPQPLDRGGISALQSVIGNRAVVAMIQRSPVKATPPSTKRRHRPPAAGSKLAHRPGRIRKRRKNDVRFLKRLPTEKLLELYLADSPDPYELIWEGESGSFTIDWVRHDPTGAFVIQDLLTGRFRAEYAQLHLYLFLVGKGPQAVMGGEADGDPYPGLPGDDARRKTLRGMIEVEMRNTPGIPPLSGPEHDALVFLARTNVDASLGNYIDACTAVKDDIRAEAAEKAEIASLILEIGFGFAGGLVGGFVSKGLDSLAEKGKVSTAFVKALETYHLSENAIEGFNKWGLSVLKGKASREAESDGDKWHPKFQTNDSAFVDGLKDRQKEISLAIKQELGTDLGLTDVQIAAIAVAYDPEIRSTAYYGAKISALLDEHRDLIEKHLKEEGLKNLDNPRTSPFSPANMR